MNLLYFISDQVVDFILDAVHLVADQGWQLLPHYRFDPETALWLHRQPLAEPPLSLHDIDYSTGAMAFRHRPHLHSDDDLAGYLDQAKAILDDLALADPPEPLGAPLVTPDFEHLRWFPLPDELLGVAGGSDG